MTEIIYFFLDISIYLAQGLLLLMLLKPATRPRSAILLTQYTVIQMFLHYSNFIKRLLYGDSMVINSSRQSMIPVLISLLITLLVGFMLIKEDKLKISYYIVTFYSIIELIKFAIHPFILWLFSWLIDLNQYLFLDKQLYGTDTFFRISGIIEVCWNILFVLILLLFAYQAIKFIKKYLDIREHYEQSQLIFLLFPSLIGLLLCMIIRSLMISVDGHDIKSLFDIRPEMNFLIPCASLLCIIMIIIAARMLRKLIDESNKQIELKVYQDRLKEMEHHIGEIENLYAGICGMKHDMKNYIADIDALMKTGTQNQSGQEALRQYLDSLQTAVEQLDMKHNTGNPVTDVILQRYMRLCQENAIDFKADFIFPADMNIDAFDISIIINNALDNALEACKRQENGSKYIKLTAYRKENMFFIIVKNSFDGRLSQDETSGRLCTSKQDSKNHGLGLRNIEVCAEKYYGRTESLVEDKEFELAVMLQKRH